MAAGGYREFLAGEILTEDLINDYLMQGVLVFAGTAARGSAIGTAVEGQFAFLKDSDQLTYYSGSAWEVLESETPYATISTTPTGTYNDGTFDYDFWIFKSNSTLTVTSAGRIDYLIVGGGATGNSNNTLSNVGGGGAGGVIQSAEYAQILAGSYAIAIGAGGAATTVTPGSNNGSNSSIASVGTAIGGGGASNRGVAGVSGGCGGGGGDDNGVVNARLIGGDGTFAQGFRGGFGAGNGGGGGGAGANGTDDGGAGGVGRTSTIIPSGTATLEAVGQVSGGVVYFAGGGGGGAALAAGGLGGGGAAAANDGRSANCAANTGGGSGASDTTQGSPYAGAGGSGVVIVRTRV